MSRKREKSSPVVWMVLLAVLAVTIIFAAILGPRRALSIGAASALSTLVDDLHEPDAPHRLRVLEVEVDEAHIEALNSDLPWSGGQQGEAAVLLNGVRYPAKFRYRGALTPSHFLGEKRSFRLTFKDPPPQLPFKKVNVINPKSFNMLNNHMGLWIGGFMGVRVPHHELVQVRLNGKELGVMELYEQPTGDFEEVRGSALGQVPVYKGDFGPVSDRKLGSRKLLWTDAAHWQYESKADSVTANVRLKALVGILGDRRMSMELRRDSLTRLLDVDQYLRYLAAIWVVNTSHIDQYHNQFLVFDPRDQRFRPILWDALLMYEQPGRPRYFIHDALAYWMLQVPEWRLQRDRYAWQALLVLHDEGRFLQRWSQEEQRLLPSLLMDKNKYANVTLFAEDVHRYSVVHAASSSASMRAGVKDHWDQLQDRIAACQVRQVRSGNELMLTTEDECPVIVSWPVNDTVSVAVVGEGRTFQVERLNGTERVVIHRTVHCSGPAPDPFLPGQHFEVDPLQVTLNFVPAIPPGLRITNAITDEAVQ